MQETNELLTHRVMGTCTCGSPLYTQHERGRFTDARGGRELVCTNPKCSLIWSHPPRTNYASLDEVYHTFDKAYHTLISQGVTRPNAAIMSKMITLMINKTINWPAIPLAQWGYIIVDGEIVQAEAQA